MSKMSSSDGTGAPASEVPDGVDIKDEVATSAGAAPSRARRRTWTRIGVTVLGSVAVVVAVVALRDRVDAVARIEFVWPAPGWIALCVATNVAGNAVLTDAWRVGVRLAGHELSFPTAGRVWGISQFSRFLFPGATVGARAGLGVQHGVPASIGAATTLFEFVWSLAAMPLLLLATLPWWLSALPDGLAWVPWTALLPLGVVVALVAAPRWTLGIAARGVGAVPLLRDRLGGASEALAAVPLNRRVAGGLLVRYLVNLVLRVVGFLGLVVGSVRGVLTSDELLLVVGAYAVGRFVGRLALFAPGGLGPREGATLLVLGRLLGVGGATLVVLLERLLELVAEVVLLGLCSAPALRRGSR